MEKIGKVFEDIRQIEASQTLYKIFYRQNFMCRFENRLLMIWNDSNECSKGFRMQDDTHASTFSGFYSGL